MVSGLFYRQHLSESYNFHMNSIKIFIFSLVLSLTTFAASMTKVQMNVPQMSFQNNKGTGSLQNMAFELDGGLNQNLGTESSAASVRIDLVRSGRTLKAAAGPLSLTMQNATDLLVKLNYFDIAKLNLNMGSQDRHHLTAVKLNLSHQAIGEMNAEDLAVKCQHKDTYIVDIPQIVAGCLSQSTIRAERLEVPDMNTFWEESFFGLPQLLDPEFLQTAKDLELEITKGDFDLSLKLKGIPLLRLRGYGNIKADMANKTATIRVDKVKYGLLGVTDIVMSQLKKKLPPENFRVESPYIYATWK